MSEYQRSRKFIPSIGPNDTVRIFDAVTGQLHRTIPVGGKIQTAPIALDNELYCEVKVGNSIYLKYFQLPNGNLTKTVPINR